MDAKELKEKIDSVVVRYNEKPKDGEYGVISLMNEINDLIEENGAFHTLKGAENPLIYEMFYLNSILKWNKTYKHKVSLLESYFNEEIYKVSMNQNIFNSLPKSKRENVNKLTLNSYEPTDKSMKDLMSVFCSTDDLRPALMGANYNELGVVSTDAYKMLFLNKKDNKYKKDVTKCVTDYCVKSHKKLGITESQFPNWKLITPTKDYANLDFVFDVDALFSYLTICLNFGLFYKGGVGERDAVVTFDFIKNNNSDDSIFSFNIEYLLDCLKGLIKLGISEARINYSSPSKAIVFTDAKVIEKDFLNQNFILLMPVITGDMFKNYYFDFKTNSVVYGEKKYEFPIGIEEKVQKEINTFEYKDVKINITLDELSNYPKIKDKLSKLSDSKLKKSIKGGCSTNYNIGSNTYSCKYNIIEVENETNIEKKESISTIYNIEILNGTFGNQDVSHDVERKVLEYFGRIKKVEEVKTENKKETPTESKTDNDVFDATKLDVNNSISSRVYSKGVDNEINKILQNNYTSVYDFDKKGIEWIYKNTRYNVKDEDLTLELKGALIERNVGVVDTMRINNELPRIESKYGKDVNLAKRMYKEAKDFYESKLRNEKSIRANEVFIDYLISRLKETKKEETPTESKSDLEFLNEMLKTSKNLLDLISDTGNKEDVDYLKKKIETTKNLISLLPIDEKKKFELGGIFHGSPYHFDRFFTSKIGSGIGQQDDGWGLYLTNDKDGAKNYGKYIYETTLFKGKKPNEYNFLELKKPVPKDLVEKIVEAVYKYYNKEFDINKFNSYYDYVKNESLPKVDFNDFELIRFDYGGYLFYKTLSRTLGGDKKASLFLLDNGIDGLKSSFVKNGVNYRTDYVIFDENAITIEKTEYLPHNYYEVGGGVFLAPNGKPSNLTPEQYKLVRTNEFKEWFGDWEKDPANASKVIDENGEPLPVYHGTDKKFNVFNKSIETDYNGKYEFLVENVDVDSEKFKEIEKYNEERGSMSAYEDFWFSNISWMEGSEHILLCFLNCRTLYVDENGQGGQGAYDSYYGDGLKITNADGQNGVDYYVVNNSKQIKLADGTNTTFDGNNPDIRFDDGGISYEPFYERVRSSRLLIPNVRGGWTKEKIIKYFKSESSDTISTYKLTKYISEFDNWQQFKDHIYYHGTQSWIDKGLKPSITMSERDAERRGGGGYGQRYFGISLTKRKKTAESFSGMSSGVTIYPVILKRDAKVIERTDLQDASEIEDIIVDLYEKGIDAVWIGGGEEELVVVNPYSVLLYDKGREHHQVYGGFKSVPLTDDKIKEIYDNSLVLLNEYREELKTKLNKDEKKDFFYSLPKIQFEDGGEIKQLESENGGKLSYVLNGKEVGYLDYIYDLSSSISDDLSDYNNELYIDVVEVEKEFRNKGIAKKLINKIIEFSKTLGIDVVSLRRDSGLGCNYGEDYDQYLKKIYESIGFIEINEDCGMVYNNKFEDGGQARPFTDDGNKYVVFNEFRNYNPYKIAVNDVNNADYITLWKTDMDTGKDKKVGALKLNETSYNYRDGFLSVSEISIDRGSKGLGLGLEMYKVALKYSSDKIKGIKSYLPNRTNKKQIPKIYKKLNSVEDGDYEFIYKEHNPKIKFNDGGSVLLAPNGKPSKLTPEQYKLVRTNEFKEWFGDWENDPANASKFIDKNGEPKVALHHTSKLWVGEGGDENGDETQFDASSWSRDDGNYLFETPKTSVNPTWFYMHPENQGLKHFGSVIDFHSSDWAIPFFINVKKIFNTCNNRDLKKLEKYAVKTYGTTGYQSFIGLADELDCEEYGSIEIDYSFSGENEDSSGSIPALIKEMGYDGYTIKDEGGTIAVFDKGNYKIADGRNTNFDGNNRDILFAGGGGVFLAPNGKPSNLTPEQYKLVRTNEFKEWFGDWENDPANASKVIDKETKEPLLVYHGTNNDFTVFDKSKLGSKNFFAESSYLGFFFASNIKTSEAYIGMNTMDMAGVSFGAYDDVLNEYNPTMEDIQRDIRKVYEEISKKYKKQELDKAKEKSPFSEKIRDAGFTEEEWFKYQKEYAERQIDWNKISELSKEENDSNGNNQKYNELKDLMYNKIEEKWKVITNSNPRIIKLFLNIREPHIVDYRDNDITELSFDIKNAIEYKKDGVIFNNLKDGADVDDIFVAFESNQIKLADGTNTTFDSNNSDIRFDGGGFVISEEKGKKFIKKLSELDCDKPLTNFQMNFFGFLDSLKDDCISLGGFWYDSNTTNYGYSKMGRIVLFDIEDFYNEKERTAFIEENYPTSTPLEIQPFDDDNYEFIGIGEASMGGVFRDKRDGSILKLTASPFEVVGTTKILNAQKKDIQYEDNFAEIYSIQNIGKGVFKGTWHYKYYNEREWSGNWFAIRREDITPFNEQEQKEANCVKEIIVNYYSMFDNKNYQPEIFGSYDIYEPNREFQYLLRKRNKYSDGGDTKSNTTFDSNNPDIRFDGGGKATNYTEFFDRLKIEDGTKYIGQKFGDVFPFLKGSFSTPFKYKLRVKQYNDYLKRLSEDNYTTKAMKQRDLNKIENNKGRINKVKYLSEFVCDSTGTIIDFKHNTDVRFADGGSVSTSRFYATKEVDNWNDIPSTWKNINKVNKVNLKLDPNDDKFNSIFKKFLSTDELRPVMMGYNVDENGITCTNAHILAVIPTKENLQKGIFLNGKEIDGKYPNYSAVIPKDGFKSTSIVDTYKLLQYCNVALNYSDKYSFGCNFNTENGVMTFNLKLLTTILETSLKLGYEELYFKFKESNSSVVISNVKEPILGKDIILLLFPISNRGSEFKGTQNLDYDLELTCYFDFTKNEIINKDNSIVDFEMNYGENPVFTKEIISHLKLNIDTKTRLPILDNFLVEDKKIRLVNLDNNTTLLIKDVDAPTGLYYIQNNVAVYSDISIDDYPKKSPFFNDKPKAINKVNISSEYFKWILDVLNSSKGDDDLRPVMTGLNISYDGSELLFASTNGHSLGVIKANENVSFENKNNFNEIINFGKISDLINFKKDSNVVIEFYQEGNFKIITDGFDIVSKVIDGTYPNYYGVIPKNSSNKLTINNKKLIDALSSKEAQSFIKKVPSSKGATYSSLNILGEEKDGQLVISLVQTELYYRSDKEEKVLDSKVIYTDDLIFDNDANIGTTDSCILLMPMERRGTDLFYFNFSLFNKFIKPVNTQSFDLLFNNGTGKPYVVNSNNFDYTQKTSKKEVSKLKEVKAVSLKPKKQIPAESNSDLEYLKGLLSTSKDLLDLISITGNKEDIDYLKEKIKVTKTLISLIE